MTITRRTLLQSAAASATSLALPAFAQADYPNKPIRFIVPFSPGGSSDIVARLLAKDAEKVLGQPFVIENKPGAGAMIGLNELVQSRPDGYTIGIANSGMVLQPLFGGAKYNYPTELQALAQVGEVPFVLVVNSDAPYKTIDDFIAFSRANPKAISYGITGFGNTAHIGPEHLKLLAKFPMEPVNFDGGGKLITSLLGGHIQAGGINPVDIKEHVRAGKIRPLLVFGEKRLADPMYANVPTAREKGWDVVVTLWQGIGGPKGMPEPVLAKLAGGLQRIITNPEMLEAIRNAGLEPAYIAPAPFAKKWIDENARFKQVVTDTGILQVVRSQTGK